jgi:similar to stage IV sporulation protein
MGYCEVKASAEQAAALLDVCRQYGYVYDGFRGEPDGAVRLCVRLRTVARLKATCEQRGVTVEVGKPSGLPAYVMQYRRRVGLLVGMAAAVALTVFSGLFVWDVRISGNTTVTDYDIKQSLQACGFGVGTSLVGFQADHIENRVLMADDRLAWISINMKGTVAEVQVREAVHKEDAVELLPCNIVAARSGVVERIELEDGNVVVAAGQAVNEGDLLVSGLYDSDRVGFRWTHAAARVYARTLRTIQIEIPLTYEHKVYGGEKGEKDLLGAFVAERSVFFFGKEIKFSKKTGNQVGSCDTIRRSEAVGRIGDVALPISVQTVWYLPYTVETAQRTPSEAEELAYLDLSRQIGEIPGGAELIRKTITTRLTETAFYLDCELVCVEDIAKERTFDIVNES